MKGAIFSMLEAILVSGVAPDCGGLLDSETGTESGIVAGSEAGSEAGAEAGSEAGSEIELEQPLFGEEEVEPAGEPVDESADGGALAGAFVGARVADLYAGTGALGIEALSRGAGRVDFVDSSPVCQRLIRENLRATGLAERGRVVGASLPAALERVGAYGPYDLALLDPPYGDPSLERTLAALDERGILAPAALVVVEHSRRGELTASQGRLRLIRRRRHGDTEISIYRREG